MKKMITYILAIAFILACWYSFSIVLSKPFLPGPGQTLREFLNLWFEGILTKHFLISTIRVLISLTAAFVLAVPLGILLGRNTFFDMLLSPIIYVLYPLPKIVFLPIIVVLLGLGNMPKIVLIFLIVFFQIVITARDAAKSVPFHSMQSMRSLNATPWQTYRHLIWPFCFPKVLTSLRISIGTSIAVLFLAETFASRDGLGYFILDAMERREFGAMYAGIIAMGLLGILTYCVVDLVENKYCHWQKL